MEKVSMICTDGGVRHVPAYLVPELTKKGWRVVINPKRNYYPEYDQGLPSYNTPLTIPEVTDTLEGEWI